MKRFDDEVSGRTALLAGAFAGSLAMALVQRIEGVAPDTQLLTVFGSAFIGMLLGVAYDHIAFTRKPDK